LSQRIGILGGTFNPIHNGHLAAAAEVREHLKLDRILFIPSSLPPHKSEEDITSAGQRMEMVRLATADNPLFETSDVEIKRGGRSYTIDTIETLRETSPSAELHFIIGLDSFLDIQTWHEWERLLSRCGFVVIPRPGYRFTDLVKLDFMKSAAQELSGLDQGELKHAVVRSSGVSAITLVTIPLSDISSTDIRSRVKAGASIKYLLPDPVETYIIKNKLYA
jgi:nicotinate-nucleotide adenylyltransferase